jgi:4-hydroxy-tetrahydrodipicolinate reductase
MLRVAVSGYKGRMGSEVVRAVTGADDMEVVAQIEWEDDLAAVLKNTKPDAIVDFTLPESVLKNVTIALTHKVIPVVGTTGLSEANLAKIRTLCEAHQTPAIIAPNFALGAILLMRFAAEAAKYLPDVEIIEMHHEKKVDAPSGTAIKTAEMIAASRTLSPIPEIHGAFEICTGARGGRAAGDIQVHSIRLPGYVASQEVQFGAQGQRLLLRHDSIDRTSFMPGVLLALRKAKSCQGLVYGLENLL